jgi:hypothetical protein
VERLGGERLGEERLGEERLGVEWSGEVRSSEVMCRVGCSKKQKKNLAEKNSPAFREDVWIRLDASGYVWMRFVKFCQLPSIL